MAIDAMCCLQIQLYYYKRQSVDCQSLTALANEQALRELATRSLEFEFHPKFPCGSPSTVLSNFRQSSRSGNE